jgi:hypothetical protein
MILTGKTEELGEISVLLPRCPLLMLHGSEHGHPRWKADDKPPELCHYNLCVLEGEEKLEVTCLVKC